MNPTLCCAALSRPITYDSTIIGSLDIMAGHMQEAVGARESVCKPFMCAYEHRAIKCACKCVNMWVDHFAIGAIMMMVMRNDAAVSSAIMCECAWKFQRIDFVRAGVCGVIIQNRMISHRQDNARCVLLHVHGFYGQTLRVYHVTANHIQKQSIVSCTKVTHCRKILQTCFYRTCVMKVKKT